MVMTTPAWARDRVLGTLLVLAVVVGACCGSGLGPRPVHIVGSWIILVGLQVAETVLCVAVTRLPGLHASTRRFWRLIAVTSALFALSSLAQLPTAAAGPYAAAAVTGSGPQAIVLGLGALCLICALLTSPLGLSSARERFRFWLDAMTVMIGVATFAWHFSDVEGSARAGGGLAADGLVNAIFGPAAFLVMIFGVVKLLLAGSAPFTWHAGVLGCAAAAIESVGKGFAGQLVAADRTALLMGIHIVANIAFLAAIRTQQIQVRGDTGARRPRRHRPYSLLPYAAIGATYALLVWMLSGAGLTGQAWIVLGCAIASTALVVVRQLAALADNADLLGRLDAKIRELATAQEVLHRALDERDTLSAQLRHMAFHDSLTGLANRALFLDRLDGALADTRTDGGRVGLLIIDLDEFKPVNDQYGHAAGDRLLKEVALRLMKCVGVTGLVARLGGDEFAVLLERPAQPVERMVDRITAAMARPVRLGAVQVVVGASIGVAVSERGADDRAGLMHAADLAMYAAKGRAKTAGDPAVPRVA
jgi:diguanylate cyclase (GGDEF)-like protein